MIRIGSRKKKKKKSLFWMFMDHETILFNLVFNFCTQTFPEKVGTTELDARQSLTYSCRLQFFLVNKLVYFKRTEITISWCYVMTSKFQLYLYLIPRIQKRKTSFFQLFWFSKWAGFKRHVRVLEVWLHSRLWPFHSATCAFSSVPLVASIFADGYIQKGQEGTCFGFCFSLPRGLV